MKNFGTARRESVRLAEDVDRVLDAAQGLARQARSMHASERLEAARRETADLSVELAAFVDRVSDVVVSCQAVRRVVCSCGEPKGPTPLFLPVLHLRHDFCFAFAGDRSGCGGPAGAGESGGGVGRHVRRVSWKAVVAAH